MPERSVKMMLQDIGYYKLLKIIENCIEISVLYCNDNYISVNADN